MRRRSSIALSVVIFLICAASAAAAMIDPDQLSGTFSPAEPAVRFSEEPGKVHLLDSLVYRDLKNEYWVAPDGITVDGASIPQFFWSFIGGPFEGRYLKASIIHDHYCTIRSRPSDEVHAAFYEGMLQSGVEPTQAWIMYTAVEMFGDDWEIQQPADCIATNHDVSGTDGVTIGIQTCTVNSNAIPTLLPARPINAATLAEFYARLQEQGLAAEVEELRQQLPALEMSE